MNGPKVQTPNVVADASQTILRTKMIEHILPARVVVEFRSRQRLIVNHKIRPHLRHVKGVVPLATDLQYNKNSSFFCKYNKRIIYSKIEIQQ